LALRSESSTGSPRARVFSGCLNNGAFAASHSRDCMNDLRGAMTETRKLAAVLAADFDVTREWDRKR
jgi:hypothetical protein